MENSDMEDVNISLIDNETFMNVTDNEGDSFSHPWYSQLMWYLLFGSMVLVAVGGNLIVIFIVTVDRKMRSVTNVFIVNLSIADAINAIFNVSLNAFYMLHMHWPFGLFFCKFNQFVAILSICASVFTLMAISFDRYWAIIYPLRTRIGLRATLLIVLWIWLASVAVSLPYAIFFTTETLDERGGNRTLCRFVPPPSNPDLEFNYNILLPAITYVLPMGCMAVTYAKMGRLLWGSETVGEPTPGQRDTLRAKRKVVKMMIVVVTMFGVCWLPYHLYFIIVDKFPEITTYRHTQTIYLFIYWLAMSNSMYNPIIYCWLNDKFRNGFKSVFYHCLPCIPWLKPTSSLRPGHTISTYYSSTGSPDFPRKFGHGRSIALHTLQNPSPASTITTRYDNNGRSSTRSSSIANSTIHSLSSCMKPGARTCGMNLPSDPAYCATAYAGSRQNNRYYSRTPLEPKLNISGDHNVDDALKTPSEYSFAEVIHPLDYNDDAKKGEPTIDVISPGLESCSEKIALSISPLLECSSSGTSPLVKISPSTIESDCPLVVVEADENLLSNYFKKPLTSAEHSAPSDLEDSEDRAY
ncbi:G protein-coupled receptor rhodopsin-like [Trinorchestia longiramus]|nr:G protein-coupled receptor rhodopsin-like [Trinorchestia longiramus]